MPFSIIVGAHSTNRAIGAKGKIPWKCRADMNFFKEITSKVSDSTKMNAVIMGRKTFESLSKPLPNRLNVVLSKGGSVLSTLYEYGPSEFHAYVFTSDPTVSKLGSEKKKIGEMISIPKNVVIHDTFDNAITKLEQDPNIETIFVIGGENVYKQAINHPKCEKIYLNEVHVVCDLSESDAFFPNPDPNMYKLVETTIIDLTVTSFVFSAI